MQTPTLSLFSIILAVGIGQTIFLILSLLTTGKNRRDANSILAIFMGIFALELCNSFLLETGYIFQLPEWYLFEHISDFLYGPVFYLYVAKIIGKSHSFSKARSMLHLLPVACVIVLATALLLNHSSSEILSYISENETEAETKATVWIDVAVFFQMLFGIISMLWYLKNSYKLLDNHQKKIGDRYSFKEAVDLSWLRIFLFSLFIVFIVYVATFMGLVFADDEIKWGEQLLYLSLVFCVFYLAYKAIAQPQIFSESDGNMMNDNKVTQKQESKSETEKTSYQNSALTDEDSLMVFKAIKEQITQEELFLNPKLSLSNLAGTSGFKSHYISQAINQNTDGNFFDFINSFRMKTAKDLLAVDKATSVNILDVAMNAGFNSKSSFYTVFKKYTNQTPTQFRKNLLSD